MKQLTPFDHQSNRAINLTAGVSPSDAASMTNLASYAALTGAAYTGYVTNTSGLVLGGVNTGLATLMVNPTVGATSTTTADKAIQNYSGYTLGQFGTVTPLTIGQFASNGTSQGGSSPSVIEIASNNTITGATRTVTQAGYAQSMNFDAANGVITFFGSSGSLAAGTTLSPQINWYQATNYPYLLRMTNSGIQAFVNFTSPKIFCTQLTNTSTGAQFYYTNPQILIWTVSNGKSQYGIFPNNAGGYVSPSGGTIYGYTASMSNDPTSTATPAITAANSSTGTAVSAQGPTMEFSMFASVYTGNCQAKTIVRASTNSGIIVGNSTAAISAGAVTVFPKLAFGTFGTATSDNTSSVIVSEFAKFAASTGNLMLFASTAMGSDSTQTDSGARLQVYGTSYFSGATAYGGAIITGVASAEYGTGEINRQITASAIGAGNNYSTWYRGSTQMGSYGYSDTTTDILYYNNLLGSVSINTITHSTAGNLYVPGSILAGTTATSSANYTFSSANVTGTTSNKYQTVNIGTTNQLSFLTETYGFSAIAYNIDLTASQSAYNAHETGYTSVNRFSKSAGTHTIYTAPSVTAGTASTLAQVYQLDASGNGTFTGGLTATTGTFSGIVTAATAATATNTTQVATTAFVKSAIAAGATSSQTLDQTLTLGKVSTQTATLGSLSLNAAYTVASTTLGINAATGTGTTNATNMAMLGTTVPFTIANFQDHSTLLMGNSYFNTSQVITTNTAGFSPIIELNAQSGNINFLSQSTSQAANSATSSTYSLTLDKFGNGTFLAGVTATTGTFSGTVTTQTQTAGDNTTNAATTAFVFTAIANVNVAGKKVNYTTFASVASTSSTYSALSTDDVISVDMTAGGTQYISLPTPSNSNLGKLYTVKRLNNGSPSATLTVTTAGGGSLLQSPTWAFVAAYALQNAGVSGCSITWMSNGSTYELLYMR